MNIDLPTPGEITLRRLLAPFDAAMAKDDTREIVVNKPGSFGVEGDNGWTWHQDPTLNFRRLEAIARLGARMTSQDVSNVSPACSTRLPGGQRMTVAMPPMTPDGEISLTMRQRAKSFDPTLDWLDEKGWFRFLPQDRNWREWLREKVHSRANLVFTGAIGSSKTTGSEACAKEIPEWERVVTLESTPEWILKRVNWVPMMYAQEKKPGIGLRTAEEALELALRQRADRVLFGELRTGEAWAWLRSLQAGLRGAIATAHGSPGFDGLFNALLPMIRQSPHSAGVPQETIHQMVKQNIDVVIHCQRVDRDHGGVPYRAAHIEEVVH